MLAGRAFPAANPGCEFTDAGNRQRIVAAPGSTFTDSRGISYRVGADCGLAEIREENPDCGYEDAGKGRPITAARGSTFTDSRGMTYRVGDACQLVPIPQQGQSGLENESGAARLPAEQGPAEEAEPPSEGGPAEDVTPHLERTHLTVCGIVAGPLRRCHRRWWGRLGSAVLGALCVGRQGRRPLRPVRIDAHRVAPAGDEASPPGSCGDLAAYGEDGGASLGSQDSNLRQH